jgi:hypothetical protein
MSLSVLAYSTVTLCGALEITLGLFDGSPWPNNNFPPGLKRLHPRSLVCFDGSLCDLQRDSLRGDPRFDKIVASLAPKEAASK